MSLVFLCMVFSGIVSRADNPFYTLRSNATGYPIATAASIRLNTFSDKVSGGFTLARLYDTANTWEYFGLCANINNGMPDSKTAYTYQRQSNADNTPAALAAALASQGKKGIYQNDGLAPDFNSTTGLGVGFTIQECRDLFGLDNFVTDDYLTKTTGFGRYEKLQRAVWHYTDGMVYTGDDLICINAIDAMMAQYQSNGTGPITTLVMNYDPATGKLTFSHQGYIPPLYKTTLWWSGDTANLTVTQNGSPITSGTAVSESDDIRVSYTGAGSVSFLLNDAQNYLMNGSIKGNILHDTANTVINEGGGTKKPIQDYITGYAVFATLNDELTVSGSSDNINIPVTKNIAGVGAQDGTFQFSCTQVHDLGGDPLDASDTELTPDNLGFLSITTSGKTGTGSFNFSNVPEGTYFFMIVEQGTAPAGWTYDSGYYVSQVDVYSDGSIRYLYQYKSDPLLRESIMVSKVAFTNTYNATDMDFAIEKYVVDKNGNPVLAPDVYYYAIGEYVHFKIKITNTGAQPISNLYMTDDLVGYRAEGDGHYDSPTGGSAGGKFTKDRDPLNPNLPLAPGESVIYDFYYRQILPNMADSIINTATVKDFPGYTLTRTATAFALRTPGKALTVEKYVEGSYVMSTGRRSLGYLNAGEEIPYVIVVTNTGSTTLTNIDVTDSFQLPSETWRWGMDLPSGCTMTGGHPHIASLAPGEAKTFYFYYTIPAGASGNNILNTAYADDDSGLHAEGDDNTISVNQNNGGGAIKVTKNVAGVTKPDVKNVNPGDVVEYVITLTNTTAVDVGLPLFAPTLYEDHVGYWVLDGLDPTDPVNQIPYPIPYSAFALPDGGGVTGGTFPYGASVTYHFFWTVPSDAQPGTIRNTVLGKATFKSAVMSTDWADVFIIPIKAHDDSGQTKPGVSVDINLLDNDDLLPDPGNPSVRQTPTVVIHGSGPTKELSGNSPETPDHGTTTLNPDNTITYTPNDSIWEGIDEFEYEIWYPDLSDPANPDKGLRSRAKVYVLILGDDRITCDDYETIHLDMPSEAACTWYDAETGGHVLVNTANITVDRNDAIHYVDQWLDVNYKPNGATVSVFPKMSKVRVRFVPLAMKWSPGNSGSQDYNDPANWTNWYPNPNGLTSIAFSDTLGFVPWGCTDVLIPDTLNTYPDLTKGITGRSIENKNSGEPVCNDIWFEHGGEIAHPDLLTYHWATVELDMESNRWYMFSAPLRDFYTGDIYLTEPCPFDDQVVIYTQLYNKANPETSEMNIKWTGDFNTADHFLAAGDGVSIWADVNTPFSETEPVLMPDNKRQPDIFKHGFGFWFPKPDTYYKYYWQGTNTQVGDSTTGTFSKDDSHRFIFESCAKNDFTGNITVPVKAFAGDFIIVGNPFMSHLDFEEFFKANSEKIQPEYKIIQGFDKNLFGDFPAFQTYKDSAGVVNDPYLLGNLIAPMQSIILEAKTDFTDLTFNGNMTVTYPGNKLKTSKNISDVVTITASMGGQTNMASLIYRQGASNNFIPGEDSYKLYTEKMDDYLNDRPLVLYTSSSDGFPLEVNTFGNTDESIKLGIRTSLTGEIELDFSGIENFVSDKDIYLRDLEKGIDVDLKETPVYTFTKETADTELKDRFLLTFSGTTGMDNIQQGNTIVIFAEGDRLQVISNNDLLKSVRIFDLQGRLLEGTSPLSRTFSTTINYRGIYIIKAESDNSSEVKKIIIRQ